MTGPAKFTVLARPRFGSTRRLALAAVCLGIVPSLIILLFDAISSEPRRIPAAWISLIIGMLTGLLALILLARMLQPIGAAARAMSELAANVELEVATGKSLSELTGLVQTLDRLSSRLLGLGRRVLNQHPSTGLPTREPFLAAMAVDMEHNPAPTLLALVRLCDFDRMAAFDRPAAELALGAFGARLEGAIRDTVRLAQVDRDCFAIWFRSTAVGAASGELRALAYVLEQNLAVGGKIIAPVVAVGAAVYPEDANEPATLLSCAFAAAPKTGGAPKSVRPAYFSSTSTEGERKRFAMEQSLRQAIGDDQFVLHYQPVVDLTLGRAVGAEALIRWRHPDLGIVSPGEFIPILEQSGLIEELGLWVLNTACRDARSWRVAGVGDLRMAVNLSARQFRDPSLAMTVVRVLEHHRLEPKDLELELTETDAMQDAALTREVLGELRSLGVGVAIDDFGVGYSSLSYLKNLPFTKLKIDREFVIDVHERADSRAICATLVALAHGLGIELLAEGVEKREEVNALVSLGCTKFQGYFYSRPLTAPAFLETVTNTQWLTDLRPVVSEPLARRRRA